MKRLYAIRDNVAEAFTGAYLWIMPHDAVAIRTFGEVASDPSSGIGRHIEDYDLWCLGDLEDSISAQPLPLDESVSQEFFIETSSQRLVLRGSAWAAAQRADWATAQATPVKESAS